MVQDLNSVIIQIDFVEQSFPIHFREPIHTGHWQCTLVIVKSGSVASDLALSMLLFGKDKSKGIILGLNYHFFFLIFVYLFGFLVVALHL